MAKVKATHGRAGYVYYKELGGAPDREALSKTARVLIERNLIVGRVLDYGCGLGFDAKAQGWDAFDPYYRQEEPSGVYDTIVVNHVANVLTQGSRQSMFERVNASLTEGGHAYISVARNIPKRGKAGPRRRLQNFVVLTLPSIFVDDEEEIYDWARGAAFEDRTKEFESIS